MTPVKTQLTWEEFEQLPDDGTHYELFNGQLIALPPAKSKHSYIARRIFRQLDRFVTAQRLGEVFSEAGYKHSPMIVSGCRLRAKLI